MIKMKLITKITFTPDYTMLTAAEWACTSTERVI